MLDKLKFWKKNDDFDLPDFDNQGFNQGFNQGLNQNMPDNLGLNTGTDQMIENEMKYNSFELDDSGQQQTPRNDLRNAYNQQSQPSYNTSKNQEMDLISSKLDAIKAELDSMNQRLKNIERIAEQEVEQEKKKPLW